MADVLDARVIVEAPAAGIVAGRRDRAKAAAELRRWLDEHPHGRPQQFHGFNRLLIQLTGNETLILLTTMLESISDAVTASYKRVPHDDEARLVRKAERTRLKLIELIEQGDEVGAEELWRKRLTEAGRILVGDNGQTLVDVLSLPARSSRI